MNTCLFSDPWLLLLTGWNQRLVMQKEKGNKHQHRLTSWSVLPVLNVILDNCCGVQSKLSKRCKHHLIFHKSMTPTSMILCSQPYLVLIQPSFRICDSPTIRFLQEINHYFSFIKLQPRTNSPFATAYTYFDYSTEIKHHPKFKNNHKTLKLYKSSITINPHTKIPICINT